MNNISKDAKNDYSEFDGLLHEIVSKEPFIKKMISYINKKYEINFYNFTDYIRNVLNTTGIDRNCAWYGKIENEN